MKASLKARPLALALHFAVAGARRAVLVISVCALAAAPLATVNTAEASWLNDKMQQLAGGLGNATSPGAYSSTSRHLFTGGSIYTRNKIFNESLVSYTPPYFASGCGGINMFFGAFSFINAQQLIQLFRSVAANAVPLLFMVALAAIDNLLDEKLSWFVNLIQRINQMLSDSCNLAKGIVTHVQDAWDGKKGLMASINNLGSDLGDAFKTLMPEDHESIFDSWKLDKDSSEDRGEYGNLVYRALTKGGGVSNIFRNGATGTAKEIAEELMSITGTVITSEPKSTSDAPSSSSNTGKNTLSQSVDHRQVQPTLSLASFIDESAGYTEKGLDPVTGSKILRCGDDKCLTVTPTAWTRGTKYPDFKTYVERMLCGTDTQQCNDGAIAAIGGNGSNRSLSADEKAFIGSLPSGLGTYINQLAAASAGADGTTGAPAEFVRRTAGIIATELALDLLRQALSAVQGSLSSIQAPDIDLAFDLVNHSKANIENEAASMRSKYGDLSTAMDIGKEVLERMQGASVSPALGQRLIKLNK